MSNADTERLVTPESTKKNKFGSLAKWRNARFNRSASDGWIGAAMLAGFIILLVTLLEMLGGHGSKSRPYLEFGTWTSYDTVRGNIVRPNKTIIDCQPIQVWMLARHGTTYPTKTEINGMKKLDKIRDLIINNYRRRSINDTIPGGLSSSVIDDLKHWRPNDDWATVAEHLTLQGEREMHELGERLRKTFPELFNVTASNVKNQDFVLRAVNTEKTNSSMRYFSEGLLNAKSMVIPPIRPPRNDTLLMAYKNCEMWEKRCIKENCYEESRKFERIREVKNTLQQLNQRLGFNETLNRNWINYDDMMSMYDLCRFETIVQPGSRSVWCNLFTDWELFILEYREDLYYYYYSGPGRSWSAKLGCNPLRDLYLRFQDVVNGTTTNSTKGVFYFTDAVTLQTMRAALGMDGNSSTRLFANDFSKSINRKFRTSKLTPFAGNIMAVLYICNGSYSVSVYTAEKLEGIDGCENGLCAWSSFEKKFRKDVQTCSMDFCMK